MGDVLIKKFVGLWGNTYLVLTAEKVNNKENLIR